MLSMKKKLLSFIFDLFWNENVGINKISYRKWNFVFLN